jgi:hypothetical protein
VFPLSEAADWYTWAASGPGSRRGMSRLYGHNLSYSWNENTWHKNLLELQDRVNDDLHHEIEMAYIHAQDLQNCLCEFDKYIRAKTGEGRPKQKYHAR